MRWSSTFHVSNYISNLGRSHCNLELFHASLMMHCMWSEKEHYKKWKYLCYFIFCPAAFLRCLPQRWCLIRCLRINQWEWRMRCMWYEETYILLLRSFDIIKFKFLSWEIFTFSTPACKNCIAEKSPTHWTFWWSIWSTWEFNKLIQILVCAIECLYRHTGPDCAWRCRLSQETEWFNCGVTAGCDWRRGHPRLREMEWLPGLFGVFWEFSGASISASAHGQIEKKRRCFCSLWTHALTEKCRR
jgi:hypothetical protein